MLTRRETEVLQLLALGLKQEGGSQRPWDFNPDSQDSRLPYSKGHEMYEYAPCSLQSSKYRAHTPYEV